MTEDLTSLDQFLASVQRKALRIAQINLGDRDRALDAVQDAMMKLAQNYANRPAEQWAPLFYRILNNRITDAHRRRGRENKIFAQTPHDDDGQIIMEHAAPASANPQGAVERERAMQRLQSALSELPMRQRQVFLLRIWQGLDVAETAKAVGCGAGSVKTHLSRAMAALRKKLEGDWP